jgi:hypothetical protein
MMDGMKDMLQGIGWGDGPRPPPRAGQLVLAAAALVKYLFFR